jgi:hypothetical protein
VSVTIGWSMERPPPAKITGRRFGIFDYFKAGEGKAKTMAIGYVHYRRIDLELIKAKGYVCDVRVIGALDFARDITPKLVDETLGTLRVTGPIFASEEVKRALRPHIGNGSSKDDNT